jgi:hypothetical protein
VSRHTKSNGSYLRLLFRDLRRSPRPPNKTEAKPTAKPDDLWYYELFLKVKRADFLAAGRKANSSFEMEALLSQSWRLAEIVWGKYIWLNRAFSFTAFTLIFSAFAATSYVLRLAA